MIDYRDLVKVTPEGRIRQLEAEVAHWRLWFYLAMGWIVLINAMKMAGM